MQPLIHLIAFVVIWSSVAAAAAPPAVEAVGWLRREVYRSPTKPAYTAWVSLFPGAEGDWYLAFEQVQPADPPRPRASLDHWYRMGLPDGYDKSPYRMEVVLLRSGDDGQSWKEIARTDARFQHWAGMFAQVRTRDGRFLGTRWSCYSMKVPRRPGQFLFESTDGVDWAPLPPLLDDRFAAYPHRMKQLRDGTIVLAVPYGMMWGPDKPVPVRVSKLPYAVEDCSMSLFVSHDEGRTWDGPTGIFPGRNVTETDFVELPSGDLLAFVSGVFGAPGRQVIHRVGKRFVPGPYELIAPSEEVPETVALTADGLLVGAMRNGPYSWSDDEGVTWQPLAGSTSCGYQPMMRQLADGRIICAWHHGADDAIATADQYIGLDSFELQVNRRTTKTRLTIERVFDEGQNRFLNEYEATLTADGVPVAGKQITLWYAVQGEAGYEPYNRGILPQRMAMGGKTVVAPTNAEGVARLTIPEANLTAGPHSHYQAAAVFNADRSDGDYVPAASAICGFYVTSHGNDPNGGSGNE